MSRENEALLQENGFFDRICEALAIKNERGAKAKIAEIIGVSDNAIGFWEKGEMPGRKSLENIAQVSKRSNTSIHWLLTGEGEKFLNSDRQVNLDEAFRAVVREIVREEFERRDAENLTGELQPAEQIAVKNIGKMHDELGETKKKRKAS